MNTSIQDKNETIVGFGTFERSLNMLLVASTICFVAIATQVPTFAGNKNPDATSKSSGDKKTSSSAASKAAVKYQLYWPPQVNSYYPALELVSLSGSKINLSSFAGKVLFIEPIGMNCPGCQAYAGGNRKGGFAGFSPQTGIESIEEQLLKNGIVPSDKRVQRIQLLLYSPSMRAPTLAEAQAWSRHFGFGQRANETILIGDSRMINSASYNMIPGFQLVNQNFVLRCDSTGHHPRSDLYRELIPMMKKMLP